MHLSPAARRQRESPGPTTAAGAARSKTSSKPRHSLLILIPSTTAPGARRVLKALFLAGWLAIPFPARGADPEQIAARPSVAALNNEHGLAAKGYDVVAYFADAKPAPGKPEFSFQWQGATWQFASAEHRAAFRRAPDRYAPRYGGYCAYAVGLGRTVDIDPGQWKIVDGKLYLNANILAQSLFARDPEGHIKKADKYWPLIPRHPL